MSDYSELKRLAEDCPWEKIEGFEYAAAGGKAYCLGDGPHNHLITTFDQRFQKYIEAATPAAVLALIADNERQAEEVEIDNKIIAERDRLLAAIPECAAHGQCVPHAIDWVAGIQRERDQLKAENEELKCAQQHYDCAIGGMMHEAKVLRKDAERYRWLRDRSESIHQFYLSTPIWFTGVKFSKDNVDGTIDTAMSQGEKPGG